MRTHHRVLVATTLALLGLGVSSALAQRPQERRGFWFGFGLGYGSLGCEDCESRTGSGSGYLKLGGTVSPSILLGFEANGWAKTEDDVTFTMGAATAVVYFYPVSAKGFHLKGGLGLATADFSTEVGQVTVSYDDADVGGMLGLGWDFRIGRNVSLVPFTSIFGGGIRGPNGNKGTFNVWQLGVGLTVH